MSEATRGSKKVGGIWWKMGFKCTENRHLRMTSEGTRTHKNLQPQIWEVPSQSALSLWQSTVFPFTTSCTDDTRLLQNNHTDTDANQMDPWICLFIWKR